jgi:hypothetical protein
MIPLSTPVDLQTPSHRRGFAFAESGCSNANSDFANREVETPLSCTRWAAVTIPPTSIWGYLGRLGGGRDQLRIRSVKYIPASANSTSGDHAAIAGGK